MNIFAKLLELPKSLKYWFVFNLHENIAYFAASAVSDVLKLVKSRFMGLWFTGQLNLRDRHGIWLQKQRWINLFDSFVEVIVLEKSLKYIDLF